MSDENAQDEILARLQALIEKTAAVSERLRAATARRRKLCDRIEGVLIKPGTRSYKSQWECNDFGFFSGSNVVEKKTS